MSADDGAAHEKAPLPKPAATFSSFINKNTTGKKFAPKAARRRPAPPPTQTQTQTQTQTPATESTEPPVAPAPAQEPPAQTAPVAPSSTAVVVPVAAPQQVPTARQEESSVQPVLQEEERPSQPLPQEEQSQPEDRPQPVLPQEEATTHEPTEQAPTAQSVEPATDPSATELTGQALDSQQSTRKRRLPWVAVNHPQGNDEASPGPAKKARKTARGQQGGDAGEPEQDDVDSEDDVQPTGKRLGAKARGKRKAATTNIEDDANAQPTPKRTRRPRKAKGKATAETGEAAEDDAEPDADGGGEVAVRRKPRQTKKKKQTAEGDDETAQPKRKGRPPRQATPSDAEDEVIDPEITFMDGLASRNIRRGKLSNREKQMREIDWAAVRQRRRDEDTRPIPSKKELEEAEKALAEAGATHPEMRSQVHLVNGQIQVLQDSGTVNREADAQREIENYEVVEDRDITLRVTTRSYMKNNKRFPNEFILPGQGRRWNADLTELFYQGLRSFGTDFQMISKMFPGFTRRAIKTKFTREERENPERVKEALHGRSEIASHWDMFLHASNMDETNFADAEKIKQELADEDARVGALIEAARQETEERKEQRRLAGVSDDEEPNEKRKQKRKGKEKQATPVEEGVEIVEYLE